MLILQTGTIARHVCLNAGGDTFSRGEAAETNSKILRNFSLSGALGHVYQRVAKFSERKRTDQTAERYLLEFDVTRGEAEGRVIMGGSFQMVSYPFCACAIRPCHEPKNRFCWPVLRGRWACLLWRNRCFDRLIPAAGPRAGTCLPRRIGIWTRMRGIRRVMIGRLIGKPRIDRKVPAEERVTPPRAQTK